MQVLVMRHGPAALREEWPQDDASRPLSPDGARKTRLAARGLGCLSPHVERVASSRLVRAQQTAKIARQELEVARALELWPELDLLAEVEADLEPVRRRIHGARSQGLLLVGHEPGCSRLVSLLTCGGADVAQFEWKKAGVVWLTLQGQSAIINGFLSPRILRELARA